MTGPPGGSLWESPVRRRQAPGQHRRRSDLHRRTGRRLRQVRELVLQMRDRWASWQAAGDLGCDLVRLFGALGVAVGCLLST